MIDVDAFLERAAIMEFDGKLSRYQAEVEASKLQGVSRWQAMKAVDDAKRMGNSPEARDFSQADKRHGANAVPGVQPDTQEQARSVPQRDVQG